MRFDIPDPVFTVSAEVDYGKSGRWYEDQTYIARIEIGHVVVMERTYTTNDPIGSYMENVEDARQEILKEFGEKMKDLLA